jgi:hypothetical protein
LVDFRNIRNVSWLNNHGFKITGQKLDKKTVGFLTEINQVCIIIWLVKPL